MHYSTLNLWQKVFLQEQPRWLWFYKILSVVAGMFTPAHKLKQDHYEQVDNVKSPPLEKKFSNFPLSPQFDGYQDY